MRNDLLYVGDIIEAIERIERYTTPDLGAIEHDKPSRSLVLRYLQIVGEAARSLSATLNGAHPEVPWRDIGRFRNRLVHQYFDIDLPVVRHIVAVEVPELKRQILPILEELRRAHPEHQ